MIILFGATGDLAKKKLLPALFSLHKKNTHHEPILCVGRRQLTRESYAELMGLPVYHMDPAYSGFLKRLHYTAVNLDEPSDSFKQLVNRLGSSKKLIYLAIGEELFSKTIAFLKGSKILDRTVSIAFEKPFGHNLASAQQLHDSLSSLFKEEQIYRVDHYLGKDLVDNFLAMRFSNTLFDHIWNASCIDHVQIVLSEDVGIEGRGEYYDRAGAIKDMVQNHIMQILSLIAMEPPKKLSADAIRDAKVAVLKRLAPVSAKDCIVGQYTGYKTEQEVDGKSKTETFIAFKTAVNTARWKNVPFYVKTGKKLDSKYAEVNLVLKKPMHLFKEAVDSNVISIRLGPKQEGIALQTYAKMPGSVQQLHPVTLEFCHKCEFGPNSAEAYERLFDEMLQSNQTRFTRWDEVRESWKFTDKLSSVARKNTLELYTSGSAGPSRAQKLVPSGWVHVERKLTI